MKDCLFCKIVDGEIPCSKVYEDKDFLAFLDIAPVNKGHVLVIPKKHSKNTLDSDNEILEKIGPLLKKISLAVKEAVNADGIVITQNNCPAAGQIIMHSHFHIIPRFKNDGLKHWPKGYDYSENEMKEVADKIKNNFN